MGDINPIRLDGVWNAGFALDRHVVSSVYVGDNEFGHPVFDTERSYVGQLLYELKYRQDRKKVRQIAGLAAGFVRRVWKIHGLINLIAPVPPSNLYRSFQPVVEICRAMGTNLGVRVDTDILAKVDRSQMKNHPDEKKAEILRGAIQIKSTRTVPLKVLVVDDLYDTGSTLTAVTQALRAHGAQGVYVLTITKTRG